MALATTARSVGGALAAAALLAAGFTGAALPERACGGPEAAAQPYCDATLPIDERVEDLLARLTVEEKVGLIVNGASPVESQGLPGYQWWSEALHGIGIAPGVSFEPPTTAATSFPQVVTTSHSFNPALVHAIGAAISTEGRVFNNRGGHAGLTFWTPNINIFRDPRWGRGQETPGEDPFWSGEYAASFVRGMQEGEDGRYLKVSACCKHFAAYSVENLYNGTHRHNFDAHVTARDMADTYLPAFEACVVKGRASGIMCSYNAINGVPACADEGLLNGLARGQWAFDGYVTSDCGAVADIWYRHNYTATPEETCQAALRAGTDLDCSTFYQEHAPAALEQGLISEADLDAALRHLFRVQFRLGLFDPEEGQVYTKYDLGMLNSADHQALALKAARQGIVLLKNEGGALPFGLPRRPAFDVAKGEEEAAAAASRQLRRHGQQDQQQRRPRRRQGLSLAVVGPHANATEALLGNYFGVPPFIIPPLEGIQRYLGDDAVYALGCDINASYPNMLDAAVAAVAGADATALFLGIDRTIEDEGRDRRSIALPDPQLELAEAVLDAAAGRPVVLVIIAGGAVDLSAFAGDDRVGAILFAGYPGQSGGQAIAEVLFGDVNPSGRLTQTFYPAGFVAAAPMADMRMRPDASQGYPGRTYRFYEGDVVYPFGHGLSYSRFTLEPVPCDGPWSTTASSGGDRGGIVRLTTLSLDDPNQEVLARACVQLTNAGPAAGRYVLLGLLSPPGAGQEGAPLKSLRAFGGVRLEAGESAVAEMAFTAADFSLADEEGAWRVVPGEWTLTMEEVEVPVTVSGEER